MKITKYFLSLAAAVGMIAGCQTPEIIKIAAPEDVVAPVLGEIDGPIEITPTNMGLEKVTFAWSAADYGVPVQVNYSLEAATAAAPDTKVAITSGLTATSVEVTYEVLNQILFNDLKLADGVAEDVVFTVGAKVGETAKIYSNAVTVSCKVTAAEKVYPKLYVVGSYNGWSHDSNQYLFDFAGADAVYQGLIDFGADHAANEFKITGGAWGKDEHSMNGAHDAESKTIALVAGGGDNINVYQAKRFYHLTFDRALTLTADVSFDQIGVIGDFNGWGADVVMEFNSAKQRFYADVEFPADGGFKFRLDGGWDVSYGSTGSGVLDSGDNIPVKAGNYRVYLNMNNFGEMTYELVAGMFGMEEPTGGVTPPAEPEQPEPVSGWGLVGEYNNWGGESDVMLASDGTYLVAKGVALSGQVKFRKDGAWDVNFGAPGNVEPVEIAVNTELELVANGKNFTIAEGTYDVYLDEANAKAWFINDGSYPGGGAAPEASEWGVVGDVNGWNAPDITMYKTATEGLFVAYNVAMPAGGFKIRANNEWNDAANYGLAAAGAVEVDHCYSVITGGGSGNMTIAAGTYDIWFDRTNEKVYIMTPGKPISEAEGGQAQTPDTSDQTWHMVGNFNNWNPADDAYKMTAEGDYFVFKNFTAADGCEVKFAPGAWNGDKGGDGTFAVGTANPTGGNNIAVTAGTYDVYLAKDLSVYYFMPVGQTPVVEQTWHIVGTFNNWNPGDSAYIMEKSGDFYVYKNFTAAAGCELKFAPGAWNGDKGGNGSFAANTACSTGGSNIAVAEGTYDIYLKKDLTVYYFMTPGTTPAN